MDKDNAGFTLLEIMIVIMIIGLLATLSYPSYQKSRENAQRTVCVNNLRVLQHAADRYLFDRPGLTEMTPDDLDDYYKQPPECPAHGTYEIEIDEEAKVTCDYGDGHQLY